VLTHFGAINLLKSENKTTKIPKRPPYYNKNTFKMYLKVKHLAISTILPLCFADIQ
jgi:hypothetical protein